MGMGLYKWDGYGMVSNAVSLLNVDGTVADHIAGRVRAMTYAYVVHAIHTRQHKQPG